MRWLVLLLAACLTPYRPHALPPTGTALACLDVWLDAEMAAEGPVVVFHFGNRCDHATRVDLASVHVVALDEAGGTSPLAPYDPHHEIEPRSIDAYGYGEEWIEFDAARPVSVASLDVDVGRVGGDGPARWIRLAVSR